ncbi:MAG: HEAT repeat domain-containing protein [Candidatus Riflebacteria bacterium]
MPEAEKGRFKHLIEGLKSPDREEKLLSIAALGIIGAPQHADLLADLLSSPDEEVVEQVMVAMSRIGNPSSVKYLIEFITSENQRLANSAFNVLAEINLNPALPVAIKAAGADQPPEIRRRIIDILSNYEDIRVSSLMNEILGQTRDHGLLVAAIRYFVRCPSAERHTVLKMLATNSNWEVALAANLALSRLKDEGAFSQIRRLAKSGNSDIRQLIVEALNEYPLIEDRNIFQMFFEDSRSSVREAALRGIDLFGADERITIIRHWMHRETDKKIKKLLISRAAKEHTTLFYDEFYRNLQTSDEDLKKLAIEAIAEMGEKIADRIIIDFDRMPLVVREQMILVLGKIGGDKVVKIVEESLQAKERWLRINAVEAAASIHDDSLYQRLIELLKKRDTDVWVRATAVSALGRSRKHDYAEVVASQLNHEDARVRANAIEALADLAWLGLPDACHKMMHDRNDRVRVNAAIALWKSGHEEVFAELEKMSRDKSRWVRSSAVFALGQIKDREGAHILLNLLSDPEEIVYKNAVEALAEMGDMRALIPLLKESRKNRLPAEIFAAALKKFSHSIHRES